MSDTGVDKIISHIETTAEKDALEILNKARAEAGRIEEDARKEAEAEEDKVLSKGRRAASLEGQRIIAETQIDVRRKKMDVQEEAITKSFNETREMLRELAEQGKYGEYVYRDVLFSLVCSASEVLAGNNLELVLSEKDKKSFTKEMLKEVNGLAKRVTGRDISLSLSKETMQFLGGVVVRDNEKSVEVDNSLETKLNRLKENIRVDVAKILFGGMA